MMDAEQLGSRLRLPLIAAPMFLVSGPALVKAQCVSGVVGSFPALNARSSAQLDEWLDEISGACADWDKRHPERPAAPFAVNQIVHRTNARLEADMEVLARRRAPIVITSLGAREDVNAAVRGWGGLTLHDVIDDRFARKAVEKGAGGLIAVAAGAGGHAGVQSPFALVQEIRAWYSGPLALSGAIANGASILAARVLGADFAYVGSAFIATAEANAEPAYKQGVVEASAGEIVYTDLFSGVHGNYLAGSIRAAGLDPANLPEPGAGMDFGSGGDQVAKAWRDIWGCGQGVGVIGDVPSAADLIARLAAEYRAARDRLAQPAA